MRAMATTLDDLKTTADRNYAINPDKGAWHKNSDGTFTPAYEVVDNSLTGIIIDYGEEENSLSFFVDMQIDKDIKEAGYFDQLVRKIQELLGEVDGYANGGGGYVLTWKGIGQGQETRKAKFPVEVVEIGEIMSAFGATKRASSQSDYKGISKVIERAWGIIETAYDVNQVGKELGVHGVQDGDTVKCSLCKEMGQVGYIIQEEDSRKHHDPKNKNVPDEKL